MSATLTRPKIPATWARKLVAQKANQDAVTVHITAFTAANPSIATVSAADAAKATPGQSILLDATAGDPTTQTIIDGLMFVIGAKGATTLTLTGLNLTTAPVTGLAATGTLV